MDCPNRPGRDAARPFSAVSSMWPTLLKGGSEVDRDDKFHSPFVRPRQLVVGRTIAAAAASSDGDSCELGSLEYFVKCAIGGSLACGLTHCAITPLDLVKCRIQVDRKKYKNITHGFRVTLKEAGVRGLFLGWSPTLIGYSFQGLGKFGLYEAFKVFYSHALGEEVSYNWRTLIYLAASASAEFFADLLLCPWESVKVRMQTSTNFARTLREALPIIYHHEGANGFYKGITPLWMRQIPYTMMKFTCFERTVELLYKHVVPKPRSECSKGEQLVVTFFAGYIAGVFCAVVSHPADTVVSQLNKDKHGTIPQIIKEMGFTGMWHGLLPRIIMVGTLTAGQWFIYDAFKVYMRMPRPPPPEMPASLKKKYGIN